MAITSTIKIDEESITEAILAYVKSNGFNLTGNDVDVSITAGRGTAGTYATLAITPKSRKGTAPMSELAQIHEDKEDLPSIEELDQAIADDAEDDALDAEPTATTALFGKS